MNPFTKLLIETRQRLRSNAELAPIPFVIEHEGQPISIATRSRSAGTAILVTATAHGLKTGSHARIELMSDAGYNADDVVITVLNATSFSYVNVGADENDFAETTGLVSPLLVPIDAALKFSLAKGGLVKGSTNKIGMALLLMTPKGIASGNYRGTGTASRSLSSQAITVRLALFIAPILNAGSSGLQKQPLETLFVLQQQMLSWNRGPGQTPVALNLWDSRENPDGELSYFADFEIAQLITL